LDLLTRLVKEAPKLRGGIWDPLARATLGRELQEAIPIRIQNVADYLYMDIDQEDFHWERDFPNIAPPWPKFFMWFKATPTIRSEGRTIENEARQVEMGYLFLAKDTGNEEARWGVNCLYFMAGPAVTLFQYVAFKVTAEGRYFPWDGKPSERLSVLGGPLCLWPSGEIVGERAFQQTVTDGMTAAMTPALLAVSFCHCKNVALKAEKLPAKLVARRIRKHGWSPSQIHELHIEPMRKQLQTAGDSDLKRSLHIMRGHFKDYRDGRGLFGKHQGVYWWPFRLTDPSHTHRYTVSPPERNA